MSDPTEEARETVRAEVSKILAEPGPWTADKEARTQTLYGSLVTEDDPETVNLTDGITIGPPDAQPDETPDGATTRERDPQVYGPDPEGRTTAILDPLRTEWGEHLETDYRATPAAIAALLVGHDWARDPGTVVEDFGRSLRREYGIEGERAFVRFGLTLAQIKRKRGD